MNETQLHGVGGWLALLVISMLVLNPIWSLRPAAEFFVQEQQYLQLVHNAEWSSIKNKTYTIITLSAAFIAYAGFGLWRRRDPVAVSTAIAAMWIGGPGATLLVMLWVLGSMDQDAIPGFIASLGVAGIWTAYLMKSRRVKNTYGFQGADPHVSSTNRHSNEPTFNDPGGSRVTDEALAVNDHAGERAIHVPRDFAMDPNAPKILSENELYAIAWKETEVGKVDKGVWARAFAECNGDKDRTLSSYIRQRTEELRTKQKARLFDYIEQRETEEEKILNSEIVTLRARAKKLGETYSSLREIKKVLEKRGYGFNQIDSRDNDDFTLLMTAAQKGDESAVILLLLAGAKKYLTTTSGETAISLARGNNYLAIAKFIEEF
jgi:hypothetical protein